MLCASSQNPAELRKYSNFQLPNCNCKFLQYTLRRNFPLATILLSSCYSLAIGLLQFLLSIDLEFSTFLSPNLAISYIYPTYTQHISNIYPAYTLHISSLYLGTILYLPKGYFVSKLFIMSFVLRIFNILLFFILAKMPARCRMKKTTQTLRRAESGFL